MRRCGPRVIRGEKLTNNLVTVHARQAMSLFLPLVPPRAFARPLPAYVRWHAPSGQLDRRRRRRQLNVMIFWYRRARYDVALPSLPSYFLVVSRWPLTDLRSWTVSSRTHALLSPHASLPRTIDLKANLREDSRRIGTNIAPISAIKKLCRDLSKKLQMSIFFRGYLQFLRFYFFSNFISSHYDYGVKLVSIFFNLFLIWLMYIYLLLISW